MKKTILYDEHVKLNAKMVEYAGYLMPIEYTGLTDEHLAVRTSSGVFDVSHMGEILIEGNDATKFVNAIVTSSVPKCKKRMMYGMMLQEDGGIVDDLMMYHYHEKKILLVVNASNLAKDLLWIKSLVKNDDIQITDLSPITSQLALQGRTSEEVLSTLTSYDLTTLKMFDFDDVIIGGKVFLVSRSGYTGEDGFEIYGKHDDILMLFKLLIDKKVTPCGLGCRDTLRFEANLPLYGHEISDTINPFEATLGFAVDMNKQFIGKTVLDETLAKGLTKKVVALELLERGIARNPYEVLNINNDVIGYITTGYLLPGKERAVALAMLNEGYWELGTKVFVRIRKNLVSAVVRNKKFLSKGYKK